jgi:hypothetical protein
MMKMKFKILSISLFILIAFTVISYYLGYFNFNSVIFDNIVSLLPELISVTYLNSIDFSIFILLFLIINLFSIIKYYDNFFKFYKVYFSDTKLMVYILFFIILRCLSIHNELTILIFYKIIVFTFIASIIIRILFYNYIIPFVNFIKGLNFILELKALYISFWTLVGDSIIGLIYDKVIKYSLVNSFLNFYKSYGYFTASYKKFLEYKLGPLQVYEIIMALIIFFCFFGTKFNHLYKIIQVVIMVKFLIYMFLVFVFRVFHVLNIVYNKIESGHLELIKQWDKEQDQLESINNVLNPHNVVEGQGNFGLFFIRVVPEFIKKGGFNVYQAGKQFAKDAPVISALAGFGAFGTLGSFFIDVKQLAIAEETAKIAAKQLALEEEATQVAKDTLNEQKINNEEARKQEDLKNRGAVLETLRRREKELCSGVFKTEACKEATQDFRNQFRAVNELTSRYVIPESVRPSESGMDMLKKSAENPTPTPKPQPIDIGDILKKDVKK